MEAPPKTTSPPTTDAAITMVFVAPSLPLFCPLCPLCPLDPFCPLFCFGVAGELGFVDAVGDGRIYEVLVNVTAGVVCTVC